MGIKIPKLVKEYLERLPIEWEVVIEPGKGNTLRIISERGRHRIFSPPPFLSNPYLYKADWAHELCHALLAEKIDPIFSGSPVIGEIEPKEKRRREEILFYARMHDDLFVNDAREEFLGHQLTIEDVRLTYIGILGLIKAERRCRLEWLFKICEDPRIPWILALNIAEDERFNCGVGAIKALDLIEPSSRQKIEAILSIYHPLPRLSWNPAKDLKIFEASVQKVVSDVFKEEWKPKMVNEPNFPGRKVWSIA